MTLPRDWLQGGLFVIREHMRAPRLGKDPKIVDLLLSLDHSVLTVSEFQAVIRADHHSLPYYLEYAEVFLAAMKQISGRDCPPGLIGKQVGEWIRNQQLISYRKVLIESGISDKSC
jgi:tRNA nucleotidyltransferase (CCA-adding enzyme)